MNEEKDIGLRTEEVDEILSAPPKWILRWGITVVILVFALVAGLSCYIQYPDVMQRDVMLRIDPTKTTATIELPAEDASQLKEGQTVNIRPEHFSSAEHGVIIGVIRNVSLEKDDCSIRVSLPSGLQTTHHNVIPFRDEMEGTISITTGNSSLLERLFAKRNFP